MASEKEKEARHEHQAKDSSREHEKSHSTRSEKDSGKSAKQEEKKQSKSSSHDTRSEHQESHSKSNRDPKSGAKESRLPAGKSARTTDHEIIRRWVEDRGGSPATVKATESGEDPGLLRINFPGYSGANRLEDISWDDFFKKFDEKHLEFLYQDQTRDGETSRFWKFVAPTGQSGSKEGNKKGDKK